MFIRQLKYHLFFFSSFFKKFFIRVLVRIGFEPNERKKKDGLKEAQELSLVPYDR
jgi:hypothetical protein